MSQEPIKDYISKFIQSLTDKGRSPSTILAYSADIKQLNKYLQGKNIAVFEQVSQADIESFRDWLISQKYTTKSASRKLNAVKTFFRWLRDNKIITYDPSEEVAHPEIKNSKPKFLTPLEYRSLRDVARTDGRISAMLELILQAGLRISEISNLKIDNIKADIIIIEPYATQPRREISSNERIKAAIELYLKERPESDSNFLFISKNGNKLAVRNIRAAIDRYMQKADVPDYSVNDLRNTFIVENLKRGVDITVVSQAAGHKRLSTTERYLELAELTESGKKTELEEL